MRVAILARVSRDSSGVGRSIDEQIRDGEAWAAREGWTIVAIISETGSASRFSRRSGRNEWDEALRLVESDSIDVLLTWDHSRATRKLEGYNKLRKICSAHDVRWGYGGRLHDLSDRADKFRTGLDALLAEDEAERTSERVRRAIAANAEAGRPHGKNLYGYTRVHDATTKNLVRIEPDPIAAPVVQEAARRMLQGDTLYAIAADFNRRGISPRRPKLTAHREAEGWTPVAVKQMLTQPAYAGQRQHQGKVIGEAIWEPLIPLREWAQLQAVLNNPDRRRLNPWSVTYLLTGIGECGHGECLGRLVASRNSSVTVKDGVRTRTHYRSYTCRLAPHTSIAMKYADVIVTEYVIERLSRPDFLETSSGHENANDSARRALLLEIDGHRKWLKEVAVIAEEERDLQMLRDQKRLVEPKIELANRRLSALMKLDQRAVNLAREVDVRSAWGQMNIEDRRDVIASLMTIVIHPAKRRGARGIEQAMERVEIRWRQ